MLISVLVKMLKLISIFRGF